MAQRNSKLNSNSVRKAILDVASQLFIEKGFAGTNFQDIANALGVARTLIYYYFKDKSAILQALIENVTVAAMRQAAKVTARPDLDPADGLRELVETFAQLVLTNPTEFRVAERNEVNLRPKQQAYAEAARRGLLENFSHVIERGIQSGDFRPADSRIAALAIIGMCSWSAWWYKPGGRKQQSEIIDILADLAVHSLKHHGERRLGRAGIQDSVRILQQELTYLENTAKNGGAT